MSVNISVNIGKAELLVSFNKSAMISDVKQFLKETIIVTEKDLTTLSTVDGELLPNTYSMSDLHNQAPMDPAELVIKSLIRESNSRAGKKYKKGSKKKSKSKKKKDKKSKKKKTKRRR